MILTTERRFWARRSPTLSLLLLATVGRKKVKAVVKKWAPGAA